MHEIIASWISSVNWHEKFLITGNAVIKLLVAVLISYIIGKIAGKIISVISSRSSEDAPGTFYNALIKKRVFKRLNLLFPFLILYFLTDILFADMPKFLSTLDRLLVVIITILTLSVFNAFLNALDYFYQRFEISRKNPIKGYLQMGKIFSAIAGIIIIISMIFKKSPIGILTGFGAMTAFVMLIFRDWVLGLIASIQINANNLVVIGDSIEMEKYGVSGEVFDISLSTVKVKNWDNTISMIPAYSLISESFKNWHGVKESDGRRIKHLLYIDINSIAIPDQKTFGRINKFSLLKGTDEFKEFANFIKKGKKKRTDNGSITNIALYRKYIDLFLYERTGIQSEKKPMTKLLQPTENGVPLQIYIFTKIIDIAKYDPLVAEILEHLIVAAPEFGLRFFQNPSGVDLGKIK